jgi:glycosyltransferase involved in cell wall biosynthesis
MPDFLVFTTIIPKILGAKVLLDLRDPMPELWEIKYGDRFRILLSMQKLVENLAIRYSNKCTTVTEMFRKRLGKKGSNLKKIDVIPNVCEETFHRILPKVHKKSGPYKNKFHIVTHGLIEARYGHELVINALNLLRKEYPDIHYTIIGEGEYCKKLYALVNRLDCWSNVHFTGYIPFKELLQKFTN